MHLFLGIKEFTNPIRSWQCNRAVWRALSVAIAVALVLSMSFSIRHGSTAQAAALPSIQLMPTAQNGAQSLLPVSNLPLVGNYCTVQAGISLHDPPHTGQFAIDVAGAPVRSYWFWTGRSVDSPVGDDSLNIRVENANGTEDAELIAQQVLSANDKIYTWHSNGFRDDELAHVTEGLNTYQVSGLMIDNRAEYNHGVGVVVVYESEACPYTKVTGWFGLDSFHWTRQGELGPDSNVLCDEFPASTTTRPLHFNMAIGGVASSERGNSIWYITGQGEMPTVIVPSEDNVPVSGAVEIFDPLNGNPGREWDFNSAILTIPPGDTFACVQIESPEDDDGISAVWSGLVTSLPLDPPVVDTPNIAIDKVAAPALIRNGGGVSFTIRITNTGSVSLTNVVTSDPLVADCDAEFALMAPGAVESYSCQSLNITESFTNVISVTGSPPTGDPVTDSDDAPVAVYTPAINIEKLPDQQSVLPGESATFSITVSNIGESQLTNVVVIDPNSPLCDRTFPGLDIGESVAFTCSAPNVTTGFTNIASVTAQPPSGVSVQDSDDALVTTLGPGIQIEKTPDLQTVPAGSDILFSITVSNVGNVALTNVSVSDAIAPACTATLGTLEPGEMISYTCALNNVSESLTNIATVTGDPPVGEAIADQDDATVEVLHPAISITKSTPTKVMLVGHPVTFNIEVTNSGDVPLADVVVTDPLVPACGAELGNMAVSETKSYACELPVLTESIMNTATTAGRSPTGEIVTAEDSAAVVPLTPAISIEKSPEQQSLSPESGATFTIVVRNVGEVTLADVTVTDPLAPGCDRQLGNLPVGEEREYSCLMSNVTLTNGADTLTNTAIVTGTASLMTTIGEVPTLSIDTVEDQDTATVKTTTISSIGNRVWLDQDGNGLQDVGEPSVENVPVTLVSDDGDVIQTLATDSDGHYLFSNLQPGSYRVHFNLPNNYAFTKPRAGNSEIDSNPNPADGLTEVIALAANENNLDVDAGLIGIAQLDVSKRDNIDVIQPGGEILYTLSVTNTGDVVALNVVIVEVVPEHTTFAKEESHPGWECEGIVSGSACTYAAGDLAPQESIQIPFGVILDFPLPLNVQRIINQISVNTVNTISGRRTTTESTPLTPTALEETSEPYRSQRFFMPLIR